MTKAEIMCHQCAVLVTDALSFHAHMKTGMATGDVVDECLDIAEYVANEIIHRSDDDEEGIKAWGNYLSQFKE